MYQVNKFYTKTGRRKRLGNLEAKFRDCIIASRHVSGNVNWYLSDKELAKRLPNMTHIERAYLLWYLHGVYDTAIPSAREFYEQGKALAELITKESLELEKTANV